MTDLRKTKVEMSKFAETIMFQKYSHILKSGEKEHWNNIAYRVPKNVLKAVHASAKQIQRTQELMCERKFIPGGRYLAATGRLFHQVNNCFLFRAEDSREGWADAMEKATLALMTGGGIGIDYSDVREEGRLIRKTGGFSTGPIALMQMINEAGRFIMQGGSRRSAIWAGLNWKHPDIHKFIALKNWIPEVRSMKAKDFNFPACMDGTNISVLLDDEFFESFHDEKNALHSLAKGVYWTTVRQMLKTGEPGFSIDTGKNSKETLRNAPVCADTHVLTMLGYKKVGDIVGKPVSIYTGKRFAHDVIFKKTGENVHIVKVKMTGGREIRCDESHPFLVENWSGNKSYTRKIGTTRIPARDLKPGDSLEICRMGTQKHDILHVEYYSLGYVYGDGTFTNKGNASEITFCTDESKKCADFIKKSEKISSVNEKDGRGYTRIYFSTESDFWGGRSKDIFPEDMYLASSFFARSFLAGLYDADGNWEPVQKRIRLSSKSRNFLRGAARLLEQYGIIAHISKAGISTYGKKQTFQLVVASEYMSKFKDFVPTIRIKPELNDYESYRASKIKVISVEPDGREDVYCADVGVEEHSFVAEGVIVSNCTEVTSADDSDVCNLGSINLARISSLDEMREAVELGVAFLLAGTVYSDVPFAKIDQVRSKNRRLGLGLMGIHEWLLVRGKKYGPDPELEEYLKIYALSGELVKPYVKEWELSQPVKTRAIAPVGTIGIIGETTTGIEPIFCSAYKRRYLKGSVWNYQYVVDPTAKRLIDSGVSSDLIEDAYSLADDVERRVSFQAWVQQYVDHSISSTINLPRWGSEFNNDNKVQDFGKMLIKYLPGLRGITVYPDGARDGQPLNAVPLSEALAHSGEIFEEAGNSCEISKGGECGA
jgi:ribonucleotide reductase alpha subunit